MRTDRVDTRWFRGRAETNFTNHLLPLAGQKLNYLEIGSWEGASILWMMENVLTNGRSRAWVVDPYGANWQYGKEEMDARYMRLSKTLKERYGRVRVKFYRQFSSVFLRAFPNGKHWFDVIYIDGDHQGLAVLDDLVLSWPLLKIGGILVLDDYEYRRKRSPIHVKAIADFWLKEFGRFIEVLFVNKQVGFKKTGDAIPDLCGIDGRRRSPGLSTIESDV